MTISDRPGIHFTPPQNFMNDPNGLVYWQGWYHLFYQINPHGSTSGNQSWGHAVSRDGLRWEHQPIALYHEEAIMMYSGSAVVDADNSAGFASAGQTALVAIYTGHSKGLQTQNIAYSLDDGQTWTKYGANPVLDIGSPQFRDPKVVWHAPSKRWVMVVVLAAEHRVCFYTSPDLKAWTLRSELGPLGLEQAQWECPDLVDLPIEDEQDSAWLLKVDHTGGLGGSGRYLVGNFDGERFTPQPEVDGGEPCFRAVDAGPDFYASQSWANMPDRERWALAWMCNWSYANQLPTDPWRGSMSLPRAWGLRRCAAGLRLVQQPVERIQAWRTPMHGLPLEAQQHDILLEWLPASRGVTGLQLGAGTAREVTVGYDAARGEVFLKRRVEPEQEIAERFNGCFRASVQPDADGVVRLRVLLDVGSVELFGNAGLRTITALVFNRPGERALTLLRDGDAPPPLVTCYALTAP